MKKVIMFGMALVVISFVGLAQSIKPVASDVVKNHILEMTVIIISDMSGTKGDTVRIRYDSLGNVVGQTEGLLGKFRMRYSYDGQGRPVYRIEYDSYNNELDSVAYVYSTNGGHTEYRFSTSAVATGPKSKDYYKHYTVFDNEGKEIMRVNVNKYNYYFYNIQGDEVRDSAIIPMSDTRVTLYEPTYDTQNRMTGRSWLSKDPFHQNTETFEYNTMGLVSKYNKTIWGKFKHYNFKEEYIYKIKPADKPSDER